MKTRDNKIEPIIESIGFGERCFIQTKKYKLQCKQISKVIVWLFPFLNSSIRIESAILPTIFDLACMRYRISQSIN
ncbi:hypothetical protein BpHYR1_011979 [Brachionus plicatilis]|uniref:Uncharacterized protein n=1 Tax=Brachionus plicatilis TaxID=10195 RepID=A0A3M7RZI5_BRAPC|nr:hypothetical protein BpHYR1_011979 [Brachionus plicatilis]